MPMGLKRAYIDRFRPLGGNYAATGSFFIASAATSAA
jgi:hypothetical protein